MDLGNILFWSVVLGVTVLPMVFPSKKIVKFICIFVIICFAWYLLYFGVRLAARNVELPSSQQFHQQVPYGDAWQDGRMATQKNADQYIFPIFSLFISLAIIGLFSRHIQRK